MKHQKRFNSQRGL